MGKGKKPQEEEVLGQIFDFIFKEAKKPIDKRRPIKLKPTGISTSKELVDGLATALAQPGLYVTDQVLSSLNDALTIEFGRINANESGSLKAKITSTNLIEFLTDPDKLLSKPKTASKMGIREAMKAGFMGRGHQELVSNAWAKKYNLDLDARKAIMGHYQAESMGREAEAGRAFAVAAGVAASGGSTGDSRKNYIVGRSVDLVGKEMFGRSGWEAMSEERKTALQKALLRGNKEVEGYITSTYGQSGIPGATSRARLGGMAFKRYGDLISREKLKTKPTGFNQGDSGIELFDLGNYSKLESSNLQGRIDEMKLYIARNPGLSTNEKQRVEIGIEQLQQASVIVSGNHLDLGKVQNAKIELRKMVTDYESKLSAAQSAGDKSKAKYYKEQIKNLKKGDRQLNTFNFWGKVGQWEGRLGAFKDVWGEGLAPNAITSILDGSLYDKNRAPDWLLPCEDKPVTLGSHSWTLKDEKGNKNSERHDEEIKIHLAAAGNTKLRSAYNKLMTNMYYLTPASVMKTFLVNGEGFVYLSHLRATEAIKALGAGGVIDFDKLMKGDHAYMAFLKSKGINAGGLKFSRRMAEVFSFGQRKRDMVKNWMDDHIFKKLRQKVYNSLIKRIRDKEALALLEKWLVKGGFEVVAKAIVIGILDALGIAATGGLGSFIVPILSSLVVDVLYGAAKILIQVVLLMTLGIIGFVFFFSSSDKKAFDSQTYAYTNVVPGEVVTNPNFKGTSPITGEDDPAHTIGDFVGGSLPDGEKCLLGSGSFHCSQGAFGNYSHKNVAAIDVTGVEYFYAPAFCGDNNCKVTYSGSTSCANGYAGGMMIFTATYKGSTYEFKLIHVQPGFGIGATLSSGQRAARVMTVQETTNACSSGKHIHIQAKMNGAIVNPRDVLNNTASSGGFGCDVSVCDK